MSDNNLSKILFNYLKPYWAKPSKEIRAFIEDKFKDGLVSCMIKGSRATLYEAAVVLLLKWGNQYWTNYTSETLLRNAMCFTEKDTQMSDSTSNIVFIYHPRGLQRNSYVEEAISHNFTMRSLSKLKTVILSEEDLPGVEESVSVAGNNIFTLPGSVVSNKKITAIKSGGSVKKSDDELGNVSEVSEDKKTGRIKVSFKRGTKFGYVPDFFKDRIKVGKPFPEGITIQWA